MKEITPEEFIDRVFKPSTCFLGWKDVTTFYGSGYDLLVFMSTDSKREFYLIRGYFR